MLRGHGGPAIKAKTDRPQVIKVGIEGMKENHIESTASGYVFVVTSKELMEQIGEAVKKAKPMSAYVESVRISAPDMDDPNYIISATVNGGLEVMASIQRFEQTLKDGLVELGLTIDAPMYGSGVISWAVMPTEDAAERARWTANVKDRREMEDQLKQRFDENLSDIIASEEPPSISSLLHQHADACGKALESAKRLQKWEPEESVDIFAEFLTGDNSAKKPVKVSVSEQCRQHAAILEQAARAARRLAALAEI